MNGRMPRQSFQPSGRNKQTVQLFVRFHHLFQSAVFGKCLVERHFRQIGNQPAERCDVPGVDIHDLADIADYLPRRQGAEGDDVGDMVFAVGFIYILQHFLTPVIGNIGVDIRHRDPFRIEETFKQQIVLQRIDHRDAETVRNQRTGGTAPAGTDIDTVFAGIADKIIDNQEVILEVHFRNYAEFILQTVDIDRIKSVVQPFFQSRHTEPRQIGSTVGIVVFRICRQAGLFQLEIGTAFVRDFLGSRQVVGIIECFHFLFRKQVSSRKQLQGRIVQCLLGADTGQDAVIRRILFIEVIHLVQRCRADPLDLAETLEQPVSFLPQGSVLIGQADVKNRQFLFHLCQHGADPFTVSFDQGLVQPSPFAIGDQEAVAAVKHQFLKACRPLLIGNQTGKPDQVAVADIVLGQQKKRHCFLMIQNLRLQAADGMDGILLTFLQKGRKPVQDVAVAENRMTKTSLPDFLNIGRNPYCTVQERIAAPYHQMHTHLSHYIPYGMRKSPISRSGMHPILFLY